MALKPEDACSSSEFQLDFGTNMSFQQAAGNRSPPEPRKRTAQHDKGHPRNGEAFIQPGPPKKHKGMHSTHLPGQERNQNNTMSPSAQTGSHTEQGGSFMHQDNSHLGGSDDKARLEAVLRDLGQDMKMIYLKWAQPFAEGEAFEGFCPARLDELLKEALRLEQHLKNQKERLRERLTLITRTLQAPVL